MLAKVFSGGAFENSPICVLSFSYYEKIVYIENVRYVLHIWNGPGQEKFRSLAKIYLNNKDILILVYDIINKRNFQELPYHEEAFKERNEGKKYVIGVAGKKSDLYDREEVSEEEARAYAEERGYLFSYTSAKNDIASFENLVKKLILKYNEIFDNFDD